MRDAESAVNGSMRNEARACVGSFLLLAAGLAATPQDSQPSALQRAIVIEDHEHDLAEAAKRYRAIGEAGGAEAAEAWLRLGTLEQRLGRAEPARVALDRALALDPGLARRVGEVRGQDSKNVDPKLRERVQEIVRKALASDPGQRQQLIENLRWLGNAVAPVLGEIVVTRKQELEEAKFAATALFALAPDAARPVLEKLFEHPDVMVRRLLLRAFPGNDSDWRPFLRFLDDRDAALRLETLRRFSASIDIEKLFALTGDADAAIQAAALYALAQRHVEDDAAADAFVQRLLDKAREHEANLDPVTLAGVARRVFLEGALQAMVVGQPKPSPTFGSEERRRLVLRFLADPLSRHLTSTPTLAQIPPEPALREEAMAAARAMGTVPEAGPTPRQTVLLQYLGATVSHWPPSATKEAIELARLGYGSSDHTLAQWLGWKSDLAHADEIVAVAGRTNAHDNLLRGLADRGASLTRWEPLREFTDPKDGRARPWAVRLLGQAAVEPARRHLVALTRAEPAQFALFADALLRGGKPASPELVELLLIETPPPAPPQHAIPQPGSWLPDPNAMKRNELVAQLLAWGSHEALVALPRAYALGLQHHPVPTAQQAQPNTSSHGPRGLTVLKDDDVRKLFDDATLATSIEACLATRREDAFDDAWSLLGPALPDAVFEVLVRHAGWHPKSGSREALVQHLLRQQDREGRPRWHPALGPLIEQTLLADKAELRHAALGAARVFGKHLDAARIRERIDQLLASKWQNKVTDAAQYLVDTKAPDVFAKLEPLARDEKSGAQAQIVRMLMLLDRERAAPLALDLLHSSDAGVRRAGIALQRTLMDPKAVKGLLECMRDENDLVRKEAAEVLEAIDLYQRTWKRWAATLGDAAGVPEAATAAEALARQALDKNERKDVRLAALASLGTLAVPETLPLLVQLLKDPDAEIAAAAKAALEKVNSTAKK